MNKKKIGIICLASRRLPLVYAQIKQLQKCTYRDFHFYLMVDQSKIDSSLVGVLERSLPNQHTVILYDDRGANYMPKIINGSSQDHEFMIKLDEDTLMLSVSWDKFFKLTESMTDEDLFCTGAISNGVPTCDLFIQNFIPESSEKINQMFSATRFPPLNQIACLGGADYTSLNLEEDSAWNSQQFFEKVWKINHHYLGIHPVRMNGGAQKEINKAIIANFPNTMKPKDCPVIRDSTAYPYFCNNIFGIKSKDWRMILSRRDLFVDPADEVPLNKYRIESKRNMVIDTGIPILHTLYNWACFMDPSYCEYETQLIKELVPLFAEA
jgi:hypothetical protein